MNIKDLIFVDRNSDTPKYMQVSEGVIRAIEQRKLVKGDQLPSLRNLSEELNISFDTAKKAYDVLKKRKIVVAAQGKSNVVNATGPLPVYRIFLLFNKLGSHKRLLYDAFTESFADLTETDLHVYNNDLQLFKHLLKTKAVGYSHYVIVPHLADDPRLIGSIIDKYLGGQRLILLDKQVEGLQSEYASVHEDFENDIINSLNEARSILKRYQKLHLIYPEESCYPPEIMKGFEKFCEQQHIPYAVHKGTGDDLQAARGDVFITITDDVLATVIQKLRAASLRIGVDAGIISYNETPLKEVLLDGITTISTDFKKMGRLAAEQIVQNRTDKIAVPFKLTLRSSL